MYVVYLSIVVVYFTKIVPIISLVPGLFSVEIYLRDLMDLIYSTGNQPEISQLSFISTQLKFVIKARRD